MSTADHPLTEQQRRWTEEYLVDGNAEAAARRAGSSARTARSIGQRNLRNPVIQAFLQAQQTWLAQGRQPSREAVIAGLLQAQALARQDANPAALLSATRALAELHGITAPDVNASIAQDKALDPLLLKFVSEQDLLAIIARRQSPQIEPAVLVPAAAWSSPGSTDPLVALGSE